VKKILTLILILLFVIPYQSSAGELTEEQHRLSGIERAMKATVMIEMLDDGILPLSYASGFFISPNSILTNYHVVSREGSTGLRMRMSDGKLCSGTVGYRNKGVDLAIIKTECTAEPLEIADNAALGQDLFVLGSAAVDFAVNAGIVAKVEEKGHVVANVFATHGNSGGAMIDSDGKVIGIVRGSEDAEYFVYGVPIKLIKYFLEQSGV
jgi:S1-C subfamily serine protease